MRILDRYVLRELLIPFGYCLGGFWIFWAAFDLFTEMADFQRDGIGMADIAQYYGLRTPEVLVLVLPIAFLLALLYALTDMARHQEVTAMRAAGVSLWRIAVPYLGVGFLLSLVVFGVNEFWVPQTVETAELIRRGKKNTPQAAANKDWQSQLGFVNTRQNRKWFIQAYNVERGIMIHPHVEWVLATGTRWEIWAERGVYRDGTWVFTNVQERVFTSNPGELPTLNETNLLVMTDFTETPEQIESEIKISRINDLRGARKAQISIREIWNYKSLHGEDSSRSAMLDTKLHGRLAAPWTCLVVVLIALPFGSAGGRRNVFVGVASSIVICFTYFVLGQVALALGARGSLPGWVAAWAPNLLFAAAGIYLTFRVR